MKNTEQKILEKLQDINRNLVCKSSTSCCPETNELLSEISDKLNKNISCTTSFSYEYLEDITLLGETPENTKLITIFCVASAPIVVSTNVGDIVVLNNGTREVFSVFSHENIVINSITYLGNGEFDGSVAINYKSITCENEEDGIYSFHYSDIYS